MTRTMEVEIDESGTIHPSQPGERIPAGHALLSWPVSEEALGYVLSERSLAKDWLRPEEDAAWVYLQPAKGSNVEV